MTTRPASPADPAPPAQPADPGDPAPRTSVVATAARADRLAPLAAVAVGLAAFALARATLLPDVATWDTAEAQAVPPLLGTMHPTGYPAYVVLGWLASIALGPLGSPAFVMNLLSAILLGVACGATVLLVRLLTGRLAIAVASGLGLAATPVAWQLGVRADVHALHLALMALLLLALVAWERARDEGSSRADRRLLAAAALLGIALAGHRLVVFLVPGIAAFVLLVDPGILRRPRLVAGALGVALGTAALLYLELPLRAGLLRAALVYGRPDTLEGLLYVVLGTQFGGAFASPLEDPAAMLGALAGAAERQLGPLWALAGAAGVATALVRPRYAVLTVPAVAITWLFAASYENAAIERYLAVPALVAWTWLGVGAAAVAGRLTGTRSGADEELPLRSDGGSDPARGSDDDGVSGVASAWARVGRAVVALALVAALLLPTAVALPRRWTSIDASAETAGRTWLEAALTALPRDAVVVSWWNWSTPLWYAQHIEDRRRDLLVVDDRTRLDQGLGGVADVIDSHLGKRPVYVIRVDEAEMVALMRRYRLSSVPLPAGQGFLRVDGVRERP